MPHLSLKTLSALRMAVGASCLLIPRHAGAMWGVPLAAGGESALFGRMVGVRDFVLGAYLWRRVGDVERATKTTADAPFRESLLRKPAGGAAAAAGGEDGGAGGAKGIPAFAQSSEAAVSVSPIDHATSNLRSALWLGLICDLVDLVSVGACWVEGNPISAMGELSIGGGAALFAAVAGQALWAGRRV
ncbi:hypothetical protein PV04_04870 [Phialophora macrospora]|uniref:Uncharacterized protein n=1 Tax=Phialophora macrospora TaxID=1851006 RepID=A0A0D2GAG1_9EURO|nr:hypothetical protein PV04_04870 [Phialophora macrospora]